MNYLALHENKRLTQYHMRPLVYVAFYLFSPRVLWKKTTITTNDACSPFSRFPKITLAERRWKKRKKKHTKSLAYPTELLCLVVAAQTDLTFLVSPSKFLEKQTVLSPPNNRLAHPLLVASTSTNQCRSTSLLYSRRSNQCLHQTYCSASSLSLYSFHSL